MACGPFETIRSQNFFSSFASALRRWSSVSSAKPTTQRRPFFAPERGDDVIRFDEMQIDRLARLRNFVRLDAYWAIVARGSGADQTIARLELLRVAAANMSSVEMIGTMRAAAGYSTSTGPADDDNFMTQCQRRLGKCPPHAATGGVR